MLREIVKIANKLDSLGLTKEADVLDTYLSKSAGYSQFIKKFPPPGIGDLFKKWLDASHIGNYTWLGSVLGGGIGSFVPTSGRTESTKIAVMQIMSICQYTQTELARDSGNDLYLWYLDNVRGAEVFGGNPSSFLAEDLTSLAETIRGVADGMKDNTPDVAQTYNNVASHLDKTAALWMARNPNKRPSPEAPSEVAPSSSEGPAVAVQAPAITPKPSAPSSASDPWAIYGSDARSLKATWLARTSATKKNPSFENFQAWLRSRSVGSKDVGAIMDRLNAEISGAGMHSAASRSSTPVEAVSSSPSSVSEKENMDWKYKMMGKL